MNKKGRGISMIWIMVGVNAVLMILGMNGIGPASFFFGNETNTTEETTEIPKECASGGTTVSFQVTPYPLSDCEKGLMNDGYDREAAEDLCRVMER